MILNLTQHQATPEQQLAGVIDLADDQLQDLKKLLTFDTIPSLSVMIDRAKKIAIIAEQNQAGYVMIGGAPFFMSTLETYLMEKCITPVYAFSVRESVEEIQKDGSVKKVNIFKHSGFVEVN